MTLQPKRLQCVERALVERVNRRHTRIASLDSCYLSTACDYFISVDTFRLFAASYGKWKDSVSGEWYVWQL